MDPPAQAEDAPDTQVAPREDALNIQEAPADNTSQIEDAYESLGDFVASSSQDELARSA